MTCSEIRRYLNIIGNALVTESMAQDRIHRDTTISTVKALAKNCEYNTARFIIQDGRIHAGDAEKFTHFDVWPSRTGVRGWVYHHDDGTYTYKAVGIYDMLPKDDPLLRSFEKAGITREPGNELKSPPNTDE